MRAIHKIGIAGATAGAVALAVPIVKQFEGVWLTAKVDTIGTGKPVSYCFGQTSEFGKVKAGTKFTPQECDKMLADSLPKYDAEISACIKVHVSDKTRAAFISFAYNVGSSAFCHSKIATRLNGGDAKGACDAMLAYNHAQGRVVKGLTNRRNAERNLCLEGLTDGNGNAGRLPDSGSNGSRLRHPDLQPHTETIDVNRAAKADRSPVPDAPHYRWIDYLRNWWRLHFS